ncbi:tetratricopeptide repeat protein [Brevibacillus ginsengisoli]|uniref:tetratricopeptide repeat protein n=1 Tax=Brevibacillus ginsengisoli TaxID=363854 RepID=UPI003CEC7F3E
MNKVIILLLAVFVLVGCDSSAFKENMDKGQQALKEQKYFEAIKVFSEAAKEKPNDQRVTEPLAEAKKKMEEEQKKIVSDYYQFVIDRKYEDAYDLLSETTKKNVSKDDFDLYQQLRSEIMKFENFKVEKGKESNTFSVTERSTNYFDGKEVVSSSIRKLVRENDTWKIIREANEGWKEKIAYDYNVIGGMYLYGKGKDKDLNLAAEYFDKAITKDPTFENAYFGLGYAYAELRRNSEALKAYQTFVDKVKDDKEKSDALVNMGIIYASMGNRKKAQETLQEAIKLDNTNEYAKTTLAAIK